MFRLGPEYAAWAAYCSAQGKAIWPQLLEKLAAGDPIVGSAITDLLKARQSLLDESVQEWARNQVRADGKFVVFSPANARIRFAKKLLAEGL